MKVNKIKNIKINIKNKNNYKDKNKYKYFIKVVSKY